MYPTAFGTEWSPSSSDGGHNRYLTDTGDSSVRVRGKCGGRPDNHSGRGRASTAPAHRDAWRSGALLQVSELRPHFPRGEGGGEHLLEVRGQQATG